MTSLSQILTMYQRTKRCPRRGRPGCACAVVSRGIPVLVQVVFPACRSIKSSERPFLVPFQPFQKRSTFYHLLYRIKKRFIFSPVLFESSELDDAVTITLTRLVTK